MARELGVLHPDYIIQCLTPSQLREWIAYSNIINKRDEEPPTKSSSQVKAKTANEAAEMFRLMAEASKKKEKK